MMSIRSKGFAALVLCILLTCFVTIALAASSYTGTVNANNVFFRMKATTKAGYYAKLQKGTKITVTGIEGDFYKITYNRQNGYMMREFVTLSTADRNALTKQSSNSIYVSATKISQLGDAPDYTHVGSTGDDVEKLQQALKIKGYYKDVVDGKFGTHTQEAVLAYQKANKLSQTGEADYATIKSLFGKVTYTTVANDPKMKGITQISQITVPKTTKKGNSGSNVIALQQALKIKGYYPWPIDGKYGDKTVQAVIEYQTKMGLSQNGEAGPDVIKSLFGKSAANFTGLKTERLNWFNGGKNVIPAGATFIVKDVRTGRTFYCRRWSGYNHMDVEPLTASDTAIMKKNYSGKWSWNRRPILVYYNSHVYAASMNGNPHGTETITDNNFAGHFCIHFYKSRTHETNNWDPDHKRCEEQAMKATW